VDTATLLEDRGNDYGDFNTLSAISQDLKNTMRRHTENNRLQSYQEEALEMIFHKIARILNGNRQKIDTWQDIAGYATLVENKLREGK